MDLLSLTQSERTELRAGKIVRMVDIFETSPLYLSDRDFRYTYGSTTILYESYLNDITGLSGVCEIFGTGQGNSSLSISIKNDARGSFKHLVALNWTRPFTMAPVTIYELRLVEDDEIFDVDVRQVIFKGVIEQITGPITEESFTLVCSGRLYAKSNSFGTQKFTKTLYPYADPQTIGKVRNVLVGDLEYVPCQIVKTSAIDLLAEPIDKSDDVTSITVSGAAQVPWPNVPFTLQIDDEQMQCTAINGRVFSITARGLLDTKLLAHNAGAPVFAVISLYVYELASHPVKSIGDVFLDGMLIDPALYNAYTGQAGSVLGGYSGRAVIAFPLKPIKGRKIAVQINDGQHTHGLASAQTLEKHPTSHQILFGTGNNLPNCYDGDLNSWGQINYGSVIGGVTYPSKVQFNLAAGGAGILTQADIHIKWNGWESEAGNWGKLKFGSNLLVTKSATFALQEKVFTVTDATKFDFTTPITVETTGLFGIAVYDVYVVFTYGGIIPHDDTIDVSTIMGGQTAADLVIGGEITAHTKGLFDTDGSVTGTVGALIERPDHVFAMLLTKYNCSLADMGDSFAASGALYASAQYKLAFIFSDVGADAPRMFAELARQCRSVFTDWAGKFELFFLPDAVAAGDADLVLNGPDDLIGVPTFNFTPSGDLKNKVNAYYRRDYRQSSGSKDSKDIVGVSPDAKAKGYMDMMESTDGDADLSEDLMLSAVRLSAMAQSVGDFWLNWKKAARLSANCTASWRAMQAGPGRKVVLADPIFGPNMYVVTRSQPYTQDFGQVGLELVWLGPLAGGYGLGGFGDNDFGE